MDALAASLAEVVGRAHVIVDADERAGYEVDWTRRFRGDARCVVRPADTAQVAEVVRRCADVGAGIVPQGGNTGLVGGSVPRGGEVIVSLRRLDHLDPVDPLAATVVAGAGVTLAGLQRHAAGAGLAFGVDLAARDTATIGGMIATNAGGIRVIRYGPMRQQVLGVEAVLAGGAVVRRMAGLVKDNSGYDLAGLLTGSEGTLGLVTAAVLKLVGRHPERVTALLAVDGIDAALDATRRLRDGLDDLQALEVMFDHGLELTRAHAALPAPFGSRHPCYLLVEVAGTADPTADLAAAVEPLDVRDVAVATDRPGRAALWAYRERHSEAVSARGITHKLDVSAPHARLADLVRTVPEVVESVAPGAEVILWGHLGDGNVHVNVLGPPADDEAVDDAVLRLVAELGGSISAEHGIGIAKRRWLDLTRTPQDLAVMRAIKSTLDPRGMLNPGVLL